MRTILAILCSLVSLACSAQIPDEVMQWTLLKATNAVSTGVTCSGTFTSGDTERFEKAEGQFCTSGLAEASDANNLLSQYATDQFVTGTHSMKYTAAGTSTAGWIRAQTADDDCSFRFYYRFNNFTNTPPGTTITIWGADSSTTLGSAPALYVLIRRNSGNLSLRLCNSATFSAHTALLSEDTWYRIEIKAVRNNTSSLRVFTVGGTEVGSVATITASDEAFTYSGLGCQLLSSATLSFSMWFENYIFNANGDYPIGADE